MRSSRISPPTPRALASTASASPLYAGSGNVYRALPLVQNPKRTAIKAAVMYYGAAAGDAPFGATCRS